MKSRKIVISSLVAISLAFSACGGGGSSGDSTQTPVETTDEIKTGYFKDSAVSGLDYVSCNESNTSCLDAGKTGIDGDFKYREGDTVRFKLGDLVIAEGPAQPLLIPADVSKDEDSSKKLGQLLMTLDADLDPSNGISIPYSVNQNAKNLTFEPDLDFYGLTQDDTQLQKLVNDISEVDKILVPEANVEEHLELSARLKLLKLSSVPIQHYLGEKAYNGSDGSNYNAQVLNVNPKKRLLVGLWQEKKKGLISKSVEYSEKTTQEEKEKARLDYAISVAKGVVDTALLLADPTEMAKDSAALKITGTTISLYSEGVKVGADIDVGAHTDLTKGILGGTVGMMDSSKGLTSGFVRGGAKDLVLSGMTYAEVDDSYKVAFDSLAWPILDAVWENAQDIAFEPNKAQILADQVEKIAKAAVNVRAAINISANTSVSDTIHAAMEYLDAYYLSAGNRDFMLSQHNMPIDIQAAYELLNERAEAASSWQDWVKFGTPPIEKSLFMTYVSESIVGISGSMRMYISQLSPSQTDVAAILSSIPEKVCNGTSFELRVSTDKGFEQDPNDISNVLWQTPSEVTSEISDLTNRVTFNKSGYYSLGVTMDVAIEGKSIGVGDFTSVLVQPCVDMSEKEGLQTLSVKSFTNEYIEFEAVVMQGYLFNGWKNDSSKVSAEAVYRYNYSDFDTVGTLSPTFTVPVPDGPLIHNALTYDIVTSPYTARIWLDRNLGATKVCESKIDSSCYGGQFQYGRSADGHEELNSTTTITKPFNYDGESSSFVLVPESEYLAEGWTYDLSVGAWIYEPTSTEERFKYGSWYTFPSQEEFLAAEVGSIAQSNIANKFIEEIIDASDIWNSDRNNVCPIGFKVPTAEELIAELPDGYSYPNILNLPLNQSRSPLDGSYISEGVSFSLWSSNSSMVWGYSSGDASIYGGARKATGLSVRCVYNEIMPFASSKSIFLNDTEIANIDVNVTYEDLSSISYEIVTPPLYGTISGSAPNYIYTPNGDYNKYDSFQYRANDGLKISNIADVNITIVKVSGTIYHNEDTYDFVVSELTGRTWLDRNLGAKRVCMELDDSECLGDYYQWGRDKDGHEKVTSTATRDQAISINSLGSQFISTYNDYEEDWANNVDTDGSLRTSKWMATDGSSVCPSGYRVPTILELESEIISSNQNNFETALKIPSSASRESGDWFAGSIKYNGALWSTDISGTKSYSRYFDTVNSYSNNITNRGNGINVRCIKAE